MDKLRVLVLCSVLVYLGASCAKRGPTEPCTSIPQPPRISPDYTDTFIPPNIAPMNFRILENGQRYYVKVSAPKGSPIEIYSRAADIKIPDGAWKTLLKENAGSSVSFEVFTFESPKGWNRYQAIANQIAAEPIDSYLVYRFIRPVYTGWHSIGIYQRNIEDYENTLVFHGDYINGACINCHSFTGNSPDRMSLAIRSEKYGNASLVSKENDLSRVGTTWGYTAWHPSGKIAAYSMNKVRQFFHTTQPENRDVVDLDSAIAYYVVKSRQVKTVPALSEKERLETYPAWSPDGRYLYYCSAPILWQDRDWVPPVNYEKVKYDLMRISYDVESDQWGQPETLLSAQETGLSIGLPRVSPDGTFLVFTMCDYGCFPVYRPSSDLYRMNLQTREYEKLDVINSPYSESWHSFSSNGRWLVFSSKKSEGLFTRTYFAYIDNAGDIHKPFILPQKDPKYYDSLLQTYSVPELITKPIEVSPAGWAAAVRSKEKISVTLPVTGATPITQGSEPWKRGGK